MEFVILIRRTLEWDKINNFENKACVDYRWKFFLNNVNKWNDSFNIDYFKYRQKLKNIALKSWEKTGIPIVEDKNFWEKNKNNKNLVILPTDDDDWYHPKIKNILKENFNNNAYVQWKSWIYDYRTTNSESFYEFDNYRDAEGNTGAGSNDYAIRCNQQKNKIYSHGLIKDKSDKDKINLPLSIWVYHPASLSWLWCNKKEKINLNKTKESTIPKEIEWAKKYIEEIRSINLSAGFLSIKFQ